MAAARAENLLVRIDRRSRWGNPFHIGRDGDRATVIERYREYLAARADLMAQLDQLRGKVLACWCAPEPCHGDVLLAVISTLTDRAEARDRSA